MTLDPRITFSRASLATYFDSVGLLKYAVHNIALQSEDFNTTWTKVSSATVTVNNTTAPNTTLTADKLNHVTAGTVPGGGVNQPLPQPVHRAVFSVYAKAGTKNWVSIGTTVATASSYAYFNLGSGVVGTKGSGWVSIGIDNIGGGWYRCYGVLSTVLGIWIRVAEVDNTVNCTSTGDIYLWGGQFEWVTTATIPSNYLPTTTAIVGAPRFDYDPITHAPLGLLIEEARTNLPVSSQDFTNINWTKTGITVTADQIAALDGTVTADLLTTSATTASVNSIALVVSAGASYTQSVYAKKGTSNWFYLCASISGTGAQTPKAYFNLNTGVVGTIEALITSATIQDVGGGWYRCSITSVGTAGTETWLAGICDADASTTVTIGRTVYLWGAQCEVGGFASSYIPTLPALSATRAADVAVMTGTNFSAWYNQPAGTFIAVFDTVLSGNRGILSADSGATSQSINLYRNSFGAARAEVTTGGSAVLAVNAGTVPAGINKLGLSAALNDFAVCFNGGTVSLDTAGAMPTPTQLRIGVDNVGSNYLNGHLRSIKFFNVAKSDADLQTLTT